MAQRKYKHPAHGDKYTPFTPEVLELFNRMRAEHGSWRRVCAVTGTRMKVMRNLRMGKRKAISQTIMDRMITTTGVGSLEEFVWFTADDLVAMGIWKPVQYVDGYKRIKGDEVHIGTNDKKPKPEKPKPRRKKKEIPFWMKGR